MSVKVVNNAEQDRYELVDGSKALGFITYRRHPDLVVLTHTEIDPEFEGRGFGGHLVRGALDDIQSQNIKMMPVCPFVQQWVARHPQYAHLDYRHGQSSTERASDQ